MHEVDEVRVCVAEVDDGVRGDVDGSPGDGLQDRMRMSQMGFMKTINCYAPHLHPEVLPGSETT